MSPLPLYPTLCGLGSYLSPTQTYQYKSESLISQFFSPIYYSILCCYSQLYFCIALELLNSFGALRASLQQITPISFAFFGGGALSIWKVNGSSLGRDLTKAEAATYVTAVSVPGPQPQWELQIILISDFAPKNHKVVGFSLGEVTVYLVGYKFVAGLPLKIFFYQSLVHFLSYSLQGLAFLVKVPVSTHSNR